MNSSILFICMLLALKCEVECVKRNDVDNIYKVIISYIINQDKPSTVVTYGLCYKAGEISVLSKLLSKIGKMFVTVLDEKSKVSTRNHELIILHDLDCPHSWMLLLEADHRKLFKRPYRWLILKDSRTSQSWSNIEKLQHLSILPDSDVLIVDRVHYNMFQLIEGKSTIIVEYLTSCFEDIYGHDSIFYKVSSSGELLQRSWGNWSHGILHGTYMVPVERRGNLLGANITVSNVVTDSPNTIHHLEDAMEPEHDSLTKMTYMVASLAIEALNGTVRPVFSPTWGYPDGHGNWSGMITHLTTGHATLGTSMLFTPERMALVDYIAMVVSTRVRFVLRQPPLSYVSNVYVLPLCPRTWAALGVIMILAVLVLYIVATSEQAIGGERHPLELEGRWGDVLFLVISAVFQQGCGFESRRVAGRVASVMLFLSLMALYAAYSANIVVLLRSPSTSIRTLQDLLNSRITLATSNTTYNRYFFPSQTEPIRKAIYQKKIAPRGVKPRFLSMREGVQGIRKGLFAFNMEVNPGYRLIEETFFESEKCGLTEIDYLNVCDPWMPIAKDSPYKELLKTKLLRVREVGLQARSSGVLVTPRPRCVGGAGLAAFSSVAIADFYPALLFMLYGFAFAGIVFTAELLLHKKFHPKGYYPAPFSQTSCFKTGESKKKTKKVPKQFNNIKKKSYPVLREFVS